VTRLPGETKTHVAKCHACHAKCRGVTGDYPVQARHQSQPSALSTQARHQSQPNAISATPATQNEGGCHEVKDDV